MSIPNITYFASSGHSYPKTKKLFLCTDFVYIVVSFIIRSASEMLISAARFDVASTPLLSFSVDSTWTSTADTNYVAKRAATIKAELYWLSFILRKI